MEKIFSPIKARIYQFIDFKGITRTEFCQKTGLSYGNFKGNAMKSELGGNQIAKILEVFSEINPEWLLLGNGEMLRNFAFNINNGTGQIVGNNNKINADFRSYNSDSPDVLRAQIEVLDERIKEKDAQIKEKDAQIKEKDAQIKALLEILKGNG